MSRYARLAIPLILVIVVAIVAVSLARDGDDGGSTSVTRPDTTSPEPAPGTPGAPQPAPNPASDVKLNRVIARVQAAALEDAPEVAAPIISRAEARGRISGGEAESLRKAARALARGKNPQQLAGTVDFTDPGVGAVARQALAELTDRAQKVARPILARAIERGDITRAQAADVRALIAAGGGYAVP